MRDDSLKQQRLALVQLLINRVADTDRPLTQKESDAVFVLVLSNIGSHSQLTNSTLDLLMRLVSNLTIAEANAQQFVDLISSSDTYRHGFQSAVEQFLSYNPQVENESDKAMVGGVDDEWIDMDPWQYMSSTLCNLCQIEDGRSFMLRRTSGGSSYIERSLKQFRSRNVVRRRGAIGCLRSCLFDQDVHWWMVVDLGVVDHIVLPLVVYMPFSEQDKKGMSPLLWMQASNPNKSSEPELDILVMLLECVVLLCQRRGVREELRKRRVYCVVRNLDVHLGEQLERVTELIYDIVNFLIGDEDQDTALDRYEDRASTLSVDKSIAGNNNIATPTLL